MDSPLSWISLTEWVPTESWRGKPDVAEGLLVSYIGPSITTVRSRLPPALVAQMESLPGKAEGQFIPHTRRDV